ncbi:competence type IV pilus ATPase ComGA [Amphibacillus jilinensis]|uniref:competence type IV pilus ATPase ComGA n=1 Tax=Amphibacillus jilinensis TaxID=1216008 RepID=UPI0003792164
MINIYSATRFIQELLKIATSNSATDIHFFPDYTSVLIFFRINGERKYHFKIHHNQYRIVLNHFKFSSGMDIGETQKPQDAALQITLNKTNINLRLSTLPVKQMESLAIRILPQLHTKALEDLILFRYQVQQFKQIMTRKAGVILLTGPTGSGKTTLLYALLDHLLIEQAYQTITLEDPIEKEMFNFLQVQINEKGGMTYHTGLKAALRHDPDLLMVGEIRDQNTAEFVFHAAYTGHLVFSTLHAKNAAGTIHRLLEMGIKPIDLSQNLIGVVALQLIPIFNCQQKKQRAAILEILSESHLSAYINDLDETQLKHQTFNELKRKAFAYGYAESASV